jgi:hypothetical protein
MCSSTDAGWLCAEKNMVEGFPNGFPTARPVWHENVRGRCTNAKDPN